MLLRNRLGKMMVEDENRELPERFHRGISNPCFIVDGCYLDKQAFHFDDYDSSRGDDYRELSINWDDDSDSIKNLLCKRKPHKDVPQFKGGYCTFNRVSLRSSLKMFFDDKRMGFERRAIEGSEEDDIQPNPYHGNILIHKDVPKIIIGNVESTLATLAESITIRND